MGSVLRSWIRPRSRLGALSAWSRNSTLGVVDIVCRGGMVAIVDLAVAAGVVVSAVFYWCQDILSTRTVVGLFVFVWTGRDLC